jgi:hypothetical protein
MVAQAECSRVFASNSSIKRGDMLKRIEVFKDGRFSEKAMGKLLVHDSPYFRVLNFNFKAGQELPIHSHDTDGQLSIVVLEGQGLFLGKDGQTLPAEVGDYCAAALMVLKEKITLEYPLEGRRRTRCKSTGSCGRPIFPRTPPKRCRLSRS